MFLTNKNLACLIALVVMSFVLLPACKQSEFSGSSGGAKNGDAKKVVKPKKLGDPEPLGQEKTPDENDEEIEKDEQDEDEEEDSEDIVNDDSDTPPVDDNDNDTDNAVQKSLIDILGALLKKPTEQITQQNDNEVVTAPGKAFRIGDGEAKDTTCAAKVIPAGVRGKIYYFEFEVKKERTEVSISFGVTCGIDYGDTNFIILKKGVAEVYKQNMTKHASNQGMPKQVLGRGKYTIIVESRNGSAESDDAPNDFDDFLVGELKVKANKPIKAGQIGAQ
jgi:hypothetical protein